MRKEAIESFENLMSPLYALDDQSALKVTDDTIEVISEGAHIEQKS